MSRTPTAAPLIGSRTTLLGAAQRLSMLALALVCIAAALGCQGPSSPSGTLPPLESPPTYQSALPVDHPPGLNPRTGTLMPDDHTVDWLKRHGPQARPQAGECLSCHLEADCITCHVETLADAWSIHPPNYVVVHALDARQNIQDCASCHQAQTFCTTCHIESRVSPDAPYDLQPPANFAMHPPGWLDAATPNNHGVMARRDIFDCASCHSEQDCVSCHTGINPHPPEFRFECRSWLETNPAPCAQCHLDMAPLRAGCL